MFVLALVSGDSVPVRKHPTKDVQPWPLAPAVAGAPTSEFATLLPNKAPQRREEIEPESGQHQAPHGKSNSLQGFRALEGDRAATRGDYGSPGLSNPAETSGARVLRVPKRLSVGIEPRAAAAAGDGELTLSKSVSGQAYRAAHPSAQKSRHHKSLRPPAWSSTGGRGPRDPRSPPTARWRLRKPLARRSQRVYGSSQPL